MARLRSETYRRFQCLSLADNRLRSTKFPPSPPPPLPPKGLSLPPQSIPNSPLAPKRAALQTPTRIPKSSNSPNALTFFLHPFAGYVFLVDRGRLENGGGATPIHKGQHTFVRFTSRRWE